MINKKNLYLFLKEKFDLINFPGKIIIINLISNLIGILHLNIPAEPEIEILSKLLSNEKSKKIILDIGAHKGRFSLYLSDELQNSEFSYYLFEPMPYYKKIKKKNFYFYNNIVSDKNEIISIWTLKIKFLKLYLKGFESIYKENVMLYKSYYNDLTNYKIQSIKIDDLKLEPSLIKVDTEGNELKVLIGASKTIKKNKPIILIEDNNNLIIKSQLLEIVNFLKNFSYKPFTYERSNKKMKLINTEKLDNLNLNIIFIEKSKIKKNSQLIKI